MLKSKVIEAASPLELQEAIDSFLASPDELEEKPQHVYHQSVSVYPKDSVVGQGENAREVRGVAYLAVLLYTT